LGKAKDRKMLSEKKTAVMWFFQSDGGNLIFKNTISKQVNNYYNLNILNKNI